MYTTHILRAITDYISEEGDVSMQIIFRITREIYIIIDYL